MAKYAPATIAKALSAFGVSTIGAAIASAHGADLSGLDLGSWIGAIGTGLVAGGAVFATPNKNHEGVPEALSPAEQMTNAAAAWAAQAAQHVADGETVKTAVEVVEQVAGTLADRVINAALP